MPDESFDPITKICIECLEELPIDLFWSNGHPSHPGSAGYKPRCRTCHPKWQAQRKEIMEQDFLPINDRFSLSALPRMMVPEEIDAVVADPANWELTDDGCKLWLGEKDKHGYPILRTSYEGNKGSYVRVRLWVFFRSWPQKYLPSQWTGHHVQNTCGLTPCISVSHLHNKQWQMEAGVTRKEPTPISGTAQEKPDNSAAWRLAILEKINAIIDELGKLRASVTEGPK